LRKAREGGEDGEKHLKRAGGKITDDDGVDKRG